MAVQYSASALERAGVVRKGGALQFVTRGDHEVALQTLRRAAERSAQQFVAAAEEGEDFLSVGGVTSAPAGPIVMLAV